MSIRAARHSHPFVCELRLFCGLQGKQWLMFFSDCGSSHEGLGSLR